MSVCFSGSHYELKNRNTDKSDDLENYIDWLNEEKYKDRKEFIKQILTFGIAILTFTITFRKDIIGSGAPNQVSLLITSWISILTSIAGALAYYFLEYRYIFYLRIKKITSHIPKSHYLGKLEYIVYTILVYITPLSFVVGIVLLSVFVIINLG